MITVKSASFSFAHDGCVEQVLEDISFRVNAEESCAIIGPSGCGKTSLIFLLAGLLKPDSGGIGIEGSPRCGTILQHFGLFPWKTVAQNIGLGLVLKGKSRTEVEQTVDQLLSEMGLSGFEQHYPGQLSGGMQQRVALARALAVDPEILFMDEPLSSLDALTRERLQNLILRIWREKRITSVLVTHSIEEAVFLGQRIIILSRRPARVLSVVDNHEAGSAAYRQTDLFFQRCSELRKYLIGESNEQET